VSQTVTQASSESGDAAAIERDLRVQLAATYRLADRYGMSELVSTHISLRVPGPTPTFLINPSGFMFHEITASSLVRVDLAGNKIGPSPHRVSPVGVAIHSAILEARPDVNCVLHAHNTYTVAVSAQECGLLPISQAAMRFHGQVAYHEYGRAGTDPTERSRLAEDMGDKWVMLMRNHGFLTTGQTAAEAFIAAYYLDLACRAQIVAQSAGVPLVMPPMEAVEDATHLRGRDEPAWPALLRLLDRDDPSYRD